MAKTEKEVVKFVDYSKTLDQAITSIERDGTKLKHKVHNVSLSIIRAWGTGQLKDQEPAAYFNALAGAAGYHGKALANWISVKVPLEYSKETDAWFVPVDAKVNGDTFKAARDEPFWEVSPPPKATPFNAVALLNDLLDRNQKRSTKAKENDKLLDAAVVKGIRALLSPSA